MPEWSTFQRRHRDEHPTTQSCRPQGARPRPTIRDPGRPQVPGIVRAVEIDVPRDRDARFEP